MTCLTCLDAIPQLVLGELDDLTTQSVKSHLQNCTRCSAEYKLYAQVSVRISSPEPDIEPAFLHSLEMSIEQECATRQQSTFILPRVLHVWQFRRIAALIVLSITITGLWIGRGKHSNPDQGLSSALASELWSLNGVSSYQTTAAHRPAVDSSAVYLLRPTENGADNLCAFSRTDGKKLWQYNSRSLGFISQGNNVVYSVCETDSRDLSLVALHSRSGEKQWQFTPPMNNHGIIGNPVTGKNQVLWFADGTIYGFGENGPVPLWQHRLPEHVRYAAVVHNSFGTAAVTSTHITALDPQTGSSRTIAALPERMSSLRTPLATLDKNNLIIAHHLLNGSGTVLCYDIATGVLQWQRSLGSVMHMERGENVVFLRSRKIYALNTKTGETVWDLPVNGCSPIVHQHMRCYLVDGSNDGILVQIDAQSGHIMCESPISPSCAGIVLSDNLGFVNDNSGVLHAVDLGKTMGCPIKADAS